VNIAPRQKEIEKQILSFLEVFEPTTEEEILTSFNYQHFQGTIQQTLRTLERRGQIIYRPRSRTFLLAHNRRNSA